MSDELFKLCAVSDLEADVPLECEAPNGDLLVVISHNGNVYAVAGECPHQQAPMADSDIIDGKIICCLHFWSWNIEDGEPIDEAEVPLPIFPIKVEDGNVYLIQ